MAILPRSTITPPSDILVEMGPAMVSVGSLAPDFHLPCTPRFDTGTETVALADFRRQGCEIVGVSSDTVESHVRWIATPVAQGGLNGLAFPLASDVDGQVS